MNRFSLILAGIAVAVTALIGHRQLLSPVALTTRDHIDSYLRIPQYVRELSEGHWPQVLPDAVQGGGSAFPRYYPPLSQWAALGTFAVTGDVVRATHLAGLAAIVLAALACLLALHLLGTGVLPSTVAAALYAVLPYPWVALDIRGAFAETWALVFYPLILAGVMLSLQARKPVRWLPLVVAGSVAGHVIMTAWAIPAIAVVALVAAWPQLHRSAVISTAACGMLGVSLMAFFVIPPILEIGSIRAADPVLMRATPEALAGVYWPYYELFRSFPWWDLLEWVLLGLGAVGVWQSRRDATISRRLTWASLIGYAALSILIRAPVEVWSLVPQPLRYIQFPQRLAGVANLFLVVSLAALAAQFRSRAAGIALGAVGAVVMLYAYHLGRQVLPRSGETHTEVLARLDTSYPDRGLSVAGEYLPMGIEPESLAAGIRRTREAVGQGPLRSWTQDGGAFAGEVDLPQPAEVALPLVAYDFYRVRVESGPVRSGKRKGQLTAILEAGPHTLRIERRLTASSRLGLMVSVLSLLVWVAWLRPYSLPDSPVDSLKSS